MDNRTPTVLHGLDIWLENWRRPVWESIYLGIESQCRLTLESAYSALESIPEYLDRDAAGLFIDLLKFEVDDSFCSDEDQRREMRLKAIDHVSEEVESDTAKVMQARILLALKSLAHHLKMAELKEQEVERLMALIPEDDHDHQSLSYLAFWAFDSANTRYLDYCYKQFLTDPFTFMVDFSRQRIRVMRALVHENCELEDIVHLIDLIPHQIHWNWIEQHIKPVCQEQRLWTSGVEITFTEKRKQLIAEGPHVPRRSQPVSFQVNF